MYNDLDPVLHSQLRLAIMSVLIGSREADFVFLREKTGSTSGNLSVQIENLKAAGYIEVEKSFRGKMPRTTCRITPAGVRAFEAYVATLRQYIGL